jgi:hypothetical protein
LRSPSQPLSTELAGRQPCSIEPSPAVADFVRPYSCRRSHLRGPLTAHLKHRGLRATPESKKASTPQRPLLFGLGAVLNVPKGAQTGVGKQAARPLVQFRLRRRDVADRREQNPKGVTCGTL